MLNLGRYNECIEICKQLIKDKDTYADEMLKKRENVDSFVEAALDRKLAEAIKEVVKLNVKTSYLVSALSLVKERSCKVCRNRPREVSEHHKR